MLTYDTDVSFVTDWSDAPQPAVRTAPDYRRRALAIWPGLDRARLRRAQNDPLRVARVAAHGTSLPIETIVMLLIGG
jgi:hypothetical protein